MTDGEKEIRNRTSANGEGSCRYLESKKLWCSRITIGWEGSGESKKQIRKAFYGKTKKEALQKATAAQARVMRGEAAVSSGMKVSEWADQWLKTYKSGLSPRTVQNYTVITNMHIKPVIGNLQLKRLKQIDIQNMITDLVNKGFSSSMVKRVQVLTNDMMEAAIDNDLLIKNPCRKVSRPPMPEVKKERLVFTPEQERAIINFVPLYLTQKLPHTPHIIGKAIIVLLKSGARTEELLALRWKDIDFKNNIIKIRQALTIRNGVPEIKQTKTYHSIRDIPMHPKIKEVLSSMEHRSEEIVFSTSEGSLWTPRNFARDYKKYFEALNKSMPTDNKIVCLSPHHCRHTFASDLRREGVDPKTISTLLGHSKVEFSMNVYTHTDYKAMADAVSRL